MYIYIYSPSCAILCSFLLIDSTCWMCGILYTSTAAMLASLRSSPLYFRHTHQYIFACNSRFSSRAILGPDVWCAWHTSIYNTNTFSSGVCSWCSCVFIMCLLLARRAARRGVLSPRWALTAQATLRLFERNGVNVLFAQRGLLRSDVTILSRTLYIKVN